MAWDDKKNRIRIESLDETDTIEIIVDEEVEPDAIEWEILEPPEARKDNEDPFSVLTLTLQHVRK